MGWRWEKDGLSVKEFLIQMKPHFIRLFSFNIGDLSHAFVNITVEAARLSAYHAGHFWAVQNFLTILLIFYVILNK